MRFISLLVLALAAVMLAPAKADANVQRIDADPAAARAILGERVWMLLTPVNLEMARRARGIEPDDVRAVVEKLEEIGASTHA